jgi:hypothetical protein
VDLVDPSRPSSSTHIGASPIPEFYRQVRRDTTGILVESIGEPRLRELRAQGAAMDRDPTYAFARAAISACLAVSPTS